MLSAEGQKQSFIMNCKELRKSMCNDLSHDKELEEIFQSSVSENSDFNFLFDEGQGRDFVHRADEEMK